MVERFQPSGGAGGSDEVRAARREEVPPSALRVKLAPAAPEVSQVEPGRRQGTAFTAPTERATTATTRPMPPQPSWGASEGQEHPRFHTLRTAHGMADI
jgi:hypothetical protein